MTHVQDPIHHAAGDHVKITVVSKDEKHLFEIVKMLRERNPSDTVNAVFGTIEKMIDIAEPEVPHALVLDQPTVDGADLDLLERLSQSHPRMAFILVCEQQTSQFLIQAMRIGVREVLAAPATRDTLVPAIMRLEEKLDGGVRAHGKVLAFVSCKGGSGATFLAANLGYALASHDATRVALIDLNLQFGDASLLVSDLAPMATLSDICQQIHRLDASLLAACMVNVTPTYAILAAPEDPTRASDVRPEHIDAILKLARQQFDFILLDIGHNLDAVSIGALDQADMIFPVLQTTLPYIRDGKRLLSVFHSLDYGAEKVHLIVNRHEKNSPIGLDDMETAIGSKVYWSVPNHYEAAASSVNQGVPLMKMARSSPISKSLQELAMRISGEAGAVTQGWFSRLFQRA
jgi:pilus assembly protein CpaE